MNPQQFALQPDSIVDLAFQRKGINYNLHINTIEGLIILKELNSREPLFIQIIEDKPQT